MANVAKRKRIVSITNLVFPETTIGALPDRLGSPGTLNIPQISMKAKTNPSPPNTDSQPLLKVLPYQPIANNAAISKKNRK